MYKMGLVSVSFRQHTPREILSAMSDAGLSVIEWGSDVHAPCDESEEMLIEIRDLCREYGIAISSYGTYFRVGVNSSDEIYSYIRAAKILGTDILRVWCGNKNSEEYDRQEKERLINECRILAKIAEDEGVTLCLECHNKTYTNCLCGALEIMNAVGSENFQMYWQPNQRRTIEENLLYAKEIAKYTKVIHVFNWRDKEKLALADAVDVWREYLKNFNSEQYLLLEFMPDGNINSLGHEADALRRITK